MFDALHGMKNLSLPISGSDSGFGPGLGDESIFSSASARASACVSAVPYDPSPATLPPSCDHYGNGDDDEDDGELTQLLLTLGNDDDDDDDAVPGVGCPGSAQPLGLPTADSSSLSFTSLSSLAPMSNNSNTSPSSEPYYQQSLMFPMATDFVGALAAAGPIAPVGVKTVSPVSITGMASPIPTPHTLMPNAGSEAGCATAVGVVVAAAAAVVY